MTKTNWQSKYNPTMLHKFKNLCTKPKETKKEKEKKRKRKEKRKEKVEPWARVAIHVIMRKE